MGERPATEDEIHVWRASLDVNSTELPHLEAVLSVDERQRADRFLFPQHANRFRAARGILRRILGRYLQVPAEDIRFEYGPRGKPALDTGYHASNICFNVSHSADMALYAVCRDRTVGVDIEMVRPIDRLEKLAERFFSRNEVEALAQLKDEQRLMGFFNAWTRKEALLKAVGTGLSFPLNRAVVTLAPTEPAAVISLDGDPQAASGWWLRALEPRAGYIGAVVVPGSGHRLQRFDCATIEF